MSTCYTDSIEKHQDMMEPGDEPGFVILGESMNYKTARWKKKRLSILKQDGYIDQYALRFGKRMPATIVHHIYPAEEYPEYQFEDWNLISVSMASHNRLENRLTGCLTDEGLRLQRQTIPGLNWRKPREDIFKL